MDVVIQLKEDRLQFAGFDNDEDKWVNIKEGVSESSIQLQTSECNKVKIGDHVLCFQVIYVYNNVLSCGNMF